MTNTRYAGRKKSEIDASGRAWHDQQTITTSCAFCRWTFVGPASVGRERALAHRLAVHPDVKQTRRRRGSLQRFNASDDSFRADGVANAAKVAGMLARREVA